MAPASAPSPERWMLGPFRSWGKRRMTVRKPAIRSHQTSTVDRERVVIERLRADAAECALIRDLATDLQKRELFDRLAEHLNVLAAEVKRAIARASARNQSPQ